MWSVCWRPFTAELTDHSVIWKCHLCPWPQDNVLKSHVCGEFSPHFSGRGTVVFVFPLPESFWLVELRTVENPDEEKAKLWFSYFWEQNPGVEGLATGSPHLLWPWPGTSEGETRGPWWQSFKEDVFRIAKIKRLSSSSPSFRWTQPRQAVLLCTSYWFLCFLSITQEPVRNGSPNRLSQKLELWSRKPPFKDGSGGASCLQAVVEFHALGFSKGTTYCGYPGIWNLGHLLRESVLVDLE